MSKVLKKIFSNKFIYILLFLIAAVFVYANMVISPKFPMYYAQYNQSIFYLIGKMMKAGKVPYVDMIDHKGIYLFLLHYLAEVICEYNHIGLYVVGLAFIFTTCVYIFKLLKLINKAFINDEPTVNVISLLATLVFLVLQGLYIISYCTLQCETFVVCGIVISIYYFTKDVDNDCSFRYKNTILYGIIFSFILFIKANYTIILGFIALYIVWNLIKNKDFKGIFKHLGFGILGIIIGLLPGIVYSIYTNSLKEMFYYTFVVNAIYSNAPYFGLKTKLESIIFTINGFKGPFLFLLVGFIIAVLVLKNKKVKTLYKNLLVVMVLLMLAIMISARDYSYYLIVLLPFISFALNSFIVLIYLNANKDNKLFMLNRSLLLTSIVIIISLVCLNINFGSRRMVDNYKNREKFIKFVESAYKERRASNKKDKLLVIGEELYLYNYFNILPSFKHFCIPIIEIDYMMQPYLETLKYVDSAAADIIVIGDGASVHEFKNYTDLQSIVNNRYDVIDMKDGRWVLQAKE